MPQEDRGRQIQKGFRVLMSDRPITGQQKSKQQFSPYNFYVTSVGTGGVQGEWVIENGQALVFSLKKKKMLLLLKTEL